MQKGSTSEPGGDHGRAVREQRGSKGAQQEALREHRKGTREHKRAEGERKYEVGFSTGAMRR